jgi:chaperonin GroEL (HSP60 family)
MKKGLHPVRIAAGMEKAAAVALRKLDEIAESLDISTSD